jgi:hypothetical protein
MILKVLERTGFASIGCFGVITIVPNAMMADSGSYKGNVLATITLSGSALNIVSGVIGTIVGRNLLTLSLAGMGMLLQFSPLGIPLYWWAKKKISELF